MKSVWQISIDDVLEIYDRARKDGVKEGESIEKYFLEYAREKGIKPIGHSELTKEEMINETASHGKNVMSIEVNKKGKTIYKFKKGTKDE